MVSQTAGGSFYVSICSAKTVQDVSCLLTPHPVPFADRLLLDIVSLIPLPDEQRIPYLCGCLENNGLVYCEAE